MVIRRFRVLVPEAGTRGPQPVWRAGTVLKSVLGLSRPERARIWRYGGVTVNGAPVAAYYVHCFPGDEVEAWYAEPASSVQPEPETPLRLLYEDEWLLAVDKPAGQLSHPARSERSGTAANAVAGYLARQTADGSLPRAEPRGRTASANERVPVRLVHRLDRETSGVLLFARDAATARALARQRADDTLERTYLALVAGRPAASGEIALAIGPDRTHRSRQRAFEAADAGAIEPEGDHSKRGDGSDLAVGTGALPALAVFGAHPAHTSYRVIAYGREASLVAAHLRTGRTHQVRVHFAASGHPLVGDDLYGGPAWPQIQRQTLHAWRTRLSHPHTGAWLTITAPLPLDFRAAAAHALK